MIKTFFAVIFILIAVDTSMSADIESRISIPELAFKHTLKTGEYFNQFYRKDKMTEKFDSTTADSNGQQIENQNK